MAKKRIDTKIPPAMVSQTIYKGKRLRWQYKAVTQR